MMRTIFATVAGILMGGLATVWTVSPAFAQNRGGNLSSGYYGGQPAVQPQYHPTYSNYGWTHYYNYYPHYGEYRNGYPYYSFNAGYPPPYSYGYSGSDALAGATDDYGTGSYRSYYPSTTAAPYQVPGQTGTRAVLTVRVPAGAEVWFDQTKTSSAGPTREYQTPPLQPGHRYAYTVRARWMENGREVTQTQTVDFTAGDRPTVTFPAPERKEPAAPPANR